MSDIMSENASRGIEEINTVAKNIDIDRSTRDAALSLYSSAVKELDLSGRKMEEVAGGALLLAIKKSQCPTNLTAYFELCSGERTAVFREKETLKQELNVETEPITAERYIEKYAESLDCPAIQELSVELLDEAVSEGFRKAGKSPRGVAGGVIYAAALIFDETPRVTQSQVADISGVTKVTLRTRYQEIVESTGYEETVEVAIEQRS